MTFDRLAKLERERVGFAVATVVARRPPVSGHLGDRAVVLEDGEMVGFIGGACARDIVRSAALRSLRTGAPEVVEIESSCASEGAVDVFIEPHVPRPLIAVAGDTPIAEALVRLAAEVGYDVVHARRLDELRPVPAETRAAIAATQGHFDEESLGVMLAAGVEFVGLVASRRRGEAVLETLRAQGVAPERLARVRVPAGLDIGARVPAAVAVAILAQIIAETQNDARSCEPVVEVTATALDPICGMAVTSATAHHRVKAGEETLYFCSAGCRETYVSRSAVHA